MGQLFVSLLQFKFWLYFSRVAQITQTKGRLVFHLSWVFRVTIEKYKFLTSRVNIQIAQASSVLQRKQIQTWNTRRAREHSSRKICFRLWKEMWNSLHSWCGNHLKPAFYSWKVAWPSTTYFRKWQTGTTMN